MWHLSRTPSNQNQNPNEEFNFHLRNSIFPVSDDSGLFQDICLIKTPNKTLVSDHNESNQEEKTCPSEMFAYLYSPTQMRSVVVPQNPREYRVQVIRVSPQRFLCAKLMRGSEPYVTLCTYSCGENCFVDVPKMRCEDRNLFSAACAIVDGWIYVVGGYKRGSLDDVPLSPLNLAERFNLTIWKWQPLKDMPNPRAYAYGIAHKRMLFVIGGASDASLKHSAEMYNPLTNSWTTIKSFVPQEAEGFSATSLNQLIVMLTWSDKLGVRLWGVDVVIKPMLACNCSIIGYFPNQIVERPRLKAHGAKMVPVGGKEVWILLGENEGIFQVDGSCAWPVFAAPMYKPNERHEVVSKGYVSAFSIIGGRISWRQIPVYSV